MRPTRANSVIEMVRHGMRHESADNEVVFLKGGRRRGKIEKRRSKERGGQGGRGGRSERRGGHEERSREKAP